MKVTKYTNFILILITLSLLGGCASESEHRDKLDEQIGNEFGFEKAFGSAYAKFDLDSVNVYSNSDTLFVYLHSRQEFESEGRIGILFDDIVYRIIEHGVTPTNLKIHYRNLKSNWRIAYDSLQIRMSYDDYSVGEPLELSKYVLSNVSAETFFRLNTVLNRLYLSKQDEELNINFATLLNRFAVECSENNESRIYRDAIAAIVIYYKSAEAHQGKSIIDIENLNDIIGFCENHDEFALNVFQLIKNNKKN